MEHKLHKKLKLGWKFDAIPCGEDARDYYRRTLPPEEFAIWENRTDPKLNQETDNIILGCTELPLAINQTHTDVKLFDTIEIIVESAVDYSLNK